MRDFRFLIITLMIFLVLAACLPVSFSTQVPSTEFTIPGEGEQTTSSHETGITPSSNSINDNSIDINPGTALRTVAQPVLIQLENAPRYILDLDIDYDHKSFRGQSRVEFTNTEATSLDRLYFRLFPNGKQSYGDGALLLDELLINDQKVPAYYSLNDSAVEIPLDQPIEPGEHLVVDFIFHGQVPELDPSGNQSGYDIYSYIDGVMTLSGWFPMLAVLDTTGWNVDPVSSIGDSVFSDIAFFNVRLTTPAKLIVAATGIQTSEQELEGKVVRTFSSGPVRDFILVLSPDFQIISKSVENVTVNAYYLPSAKEAAQAGLQIATDALQVFNDSFGEYPYTELDIVEVPLQYASGVEYPGLLLIKNTLYENPQDTFFSGTIAHEVAHQWWYNVVGNDVIDEPWLDESLASYSLGLYYEKIEGYQAAAGYWEYLQERYNTAVQNGEIGPMNESLAYYEAMGNPLAYSRSVYTQGALFFKTLREYIGDQAFFQALKNYYQEGYFLIMNQDALLKTFGQAAGRQLDEFYLEWLSMPSPPATPTPSQQSVTFAVIGDYGSGDQHAKAVADLVKSWNPDLVITVGDNNYPDGSDLTIDENIGQFYSSFIFPYIGNYGPGAETNTFFPTLGNHDWYTLDGTPYLDYFTLPGNERYYDYIRGPVHFFALDATFEEPDGIGRSSQQAAWLKERLATSTAKWKVVYGHIPAYSSGREGSITAMRWPFMKWGATIYLAGHDHDYERLNVDGFPYIVNGVGGGAIYDFDPPLPGSLVRYNDGYGALRVIAEESQITFQFITTEGLVIDTLVITSP
jgi:hypothetical protein